MKARYKKGVSEAFGFRADSNSKQAIEARANYSCPFLNARCQKPSQHRDYDASIPFGACSVWHRGEYDLLPIPYITCPIRFIQGGQIFHDSSRVLKRAEGAKVFILPEISLEMGRLDYLMVAWDSKQEKMADASILEVMASSTTTTGDILHSLHSLLGSKLEPRNLKYGINYRQIISRMIVQVIAKSFACESWGLPMVWAVQDSLFNYMAATTKLQLKTIRLEDTVSARKGHSIFFLVYSMGEGALSPQFDLQLQAVYAANRDDILGVFEPKSVPPLADIISVAEDRVRSKQKCFELGKALPYSLVELASQKLREVESDPLGFD